ncbi:MAG TPA: alpha-L-rhamnosidase N-terminal domain-containing protein [Phycisphaerae bacterium]|nr:alpha-L-rhamnosidase N-terminal domain-containing protein [Phycisphaerae bacterium]
MADEGKAARRLDASFVWTRAEPPGKQEYAVFRRAFDLDQAPAEATLRIFADVRYVLWINGRYVERGPCRFDPKRPEYDILHVTGHLQCGRNAIVVLVHYPGYVVIDEPVEKFPCQCARMMAHRPGFTAELHWTPRGGSPLRLATDGSWRVSTETWHLPSPPAYGSIFEVIDARRDTGDWTAVDFDDSSWKAAVPLDKGQWEPLHPRSIPLLREQEAGNLSVVDACPDTVQVGPLNRLLPLELSAGAKLVIDCGREMQAYSVLDFDATSGSRLEIDYAIRFFDTDRVPSLGREPKTRGQFNAYTARGGRQTYMTSDTYGCKYLVIRVLEGRIKLHDVRMVDRLYPFQRLGRFASNDKILDGIWAIGVRTVKLCSEDAHVDCADSERAQWMADGYRMGYPVSRVALAGPGRVVEPTDGSESARGAGSPFFDPVPSSSTRGGTSSDSAGTSNVSLCVTKRKPSDVLAERAFLKIGRGNGASFDAADRLHLLAVRNHEYVLADIMLIAK